MKCREPSSDPTSLAADCGRDYDAPLSCCAHSVGIMAVDELPERPAKSGYVRGGRDMPRRLSFSHH
jgi:hypothetical protein